MGKFGRILAEIITLLFTFSLFLVDGEPWGDKQALLDFMQRMPHSRFLDWNSVSPVCTAWTGVACNDQETRVIALRLPGFGFRGSIPNDTLSRLSALQILSLRNNKITGEFPSDFSKLGNLTALYLQSNNISGPLPLDFSVWPNLVVLNLSNNEFNDSIPVSISNLTHLTTLDLSNNALSGQIPDFGTPSLRYLSLANNHLNGTLPKSLVRFPSSAFAGNNVTAPADVSIPPIPSAVSPSSQPRKSKKLGDAALLGIILGGSVILFGVIAALMLVFCSNKESVQNNGAKQQKEDKMSTVKKKKVGKESPEQKNGRMTFFEGSMLAFDLEDLLRASAEVLGKGTFGTTYKAALEDTTTVVVKRLKEVAIGKREFEQQMEIVGNIKHENVAALRAFYYSKDEKLMVYDYFRAGSLHTMLHGKGRENRPPLDWETRLNVAIGVARGLAHIHSQNNKKLVHGNIKSSNIFLNAQNQGCVSDLGLATIVTPLTPPTPLRTMGYRALEVTDPRKSTQASDVYSFGVLVLELLTGKNPLDDGMHLVKWVNSVVREEWTAEVFDVELLKYPNVEEEMVTMLQLGMTCAQRIHERRPKMWEVVRMVDDIRRVPSGTQPSSAASTPTPASLSHIVEIGSTSTSVQQ